MSTRDSAFLRTLEEWLQSYPEILLLLRFSRSAGSKDFEFFTSLDSVRLRLNGLPPQTSVIAFRKPQLPLRGIVDEDFIARCLQSIPDGVEYLVVESNLREAGGYSWYHHDAGDTHGELREALYASFNAPVAVGIYPDWLEVNDDVISAIVPDEFGVVRPGVY